MLVFDCLMYQVAMCTIATPCMALYINFRVDLALPGHRSGRRMTNGKMTGKDAIDDWQRFTSYGTFAAQQSFAISLVDSCCCLHRGDRQSLSCLPVLTKPAALLVFTRCSAIIFWGATQQVRARGRHFSLAAYSANVSSPPSSKPADVDQRC